jgi:hypothetical protein
MSSNTCYEITHEFKLNSSWTCSLHLTTCEHTSNHQRVKSWARAPVNGFHEISPGDCRALYIEDDGRELSGAKRWKQREGRLVIAGMGGDSVASSNVNRSADALLIYIKVLLMMKSNVVVCYLGFKYQICHKDQLSHQGCHEPDMSLHTSTLTGT